MKNKKSNKTFTKLSEIGEFELISKLTKNVKLYNNSTVFGVGDDSAILDFGKRNVLVSSDMLVEGVHFDLSYMPLKHLGYKAIISNLSDIYSMNSQCSQVLVNLGVSNRFNLEAIEEVYFGINSACKNYGVDLVGGDTTSSNKGLIISVTAIGSKDSKSIVKRNGAKVNDLLVVSGDLGGAFLGLKILERENQLDSLKSRIKPIMGKSFNDDDFEKIAKLKDKDFEEVIKSKFDSFRDRRNKALTMEANIELEKRIFLQTVDFLWRSHLQYLEHLRQVVGLRGYAQKDPLEEFRREAFKLFEELLNKIKIDFITFLNNLEIVDKEQISQTEKTKPEENKELIPRKMKRNEPCYCDSGKKYKHCHGAL